MQMLGYIVMGLGIIFITFGVYGVFRFKDFYSRILIASKVDTAGFVTLLIGVMIANGRLFFSLKILFILLITIIANPLVSHSIARSAFLSGYKVKEDKDD
ncbi:multisubunit sodium/proton antiporter, MrpG subunit [Clostridium aceticum]|uniref:Multisubunit sodium/proton antiporter, MrpG subunit n=1 Tax=Clostridium aceticum TaxID=84022 RepID=A0A0D8IBF7_9CLOT|nr:monovalent cation/H(+) antiporter subunit G [Clostridium aceticum]AKL96417.1 multisubunit sodium/proton antiporter, MrpG subunit [Clostridium aceticum]KJF27404.1 cation:proton antiporter [Clostridium aceticum]